LLSIEPQLSKNNPQSADKSNNEREKMTHSANPTTEPDEHSNESKTVARILIVDDEEIMTDLLEDILSCAGYFVTTANNPELSLAMIKNDKQTFDLIIVDHNMPSMKGISYIKNIKKIMPNVSAILMSGDLIQNILNNEEDKRLVDHFLAKPFTGVTLMNSVSHLLS
jgi:DNA-binding NtrC family response regulator